MVVENSLKVVWMILHWIDGQFLDNQKENEKMAYTPPTLRSIARKMQGATLGTPPMSPYHLSSTCADGCGDDDCCVQGRSPW